MQIILFPIQSTADSAVDSISALCGQTGDFGAELLRYICRIQAANLNVQQTLLVDPPVNCPDFPSLSINNSTVTLPPPISNDRSSCAWVSLTDGRFITQFNSDWLCEYLSQRPEQIIFLTVDPEMSSFREKVRYNSQGHVVGFRRHYADVVWPACTPQQWPHQVLVRKSAISSLLRNNQLPLQFSEFLKNCQMASLPTAAIRTAGSVRSLMTSLGLRETVRDLLLSHPNRVNIGSGDSCDTPPRLFGQVVLGKQVQLEPGTIIIGPSVLGDRVTVGPNTIVRGSIILSDTRIDADQIIDSTILSPHSASIPTEQPAFLLPAPPARGQWYRSWPKLSYVECGKRIADILFSLCILILFLPFFPLVALAIKINSPGPLFFQHKRQGRYGREFGCIKFRTMIKDADKMQDQLRLLNRNQVDGPQFKMENDPRVSTVGKFLRDTCIDEIPQFINVLLGQMSVVGPRPSPERENTFCASWRDARLSVRPGITGLWQVNRTRTEGQDFQEWVVHDTRYVRDVSLKLDLIICWRTAIYMIKTILAKF